jgi:hypothetical protein
MEDKRFPPKHLQEIVKLRVRVKEREKEKGKWGTDDSPKEL